MRYSTSNMALKQLGNDTGNEFLIKHYAFRRWTGSVANRQ